MANSDDSPDPIDSDPRDEVSPVEDVTCAECGRALESQAAAETSGWRFYPAGAENPHPFCPECAEREFGPPA